jgi:hypothetical protein
MRQQQQRTRTYCVCVDPSTSYNEHRGALLFFIPRASLSALVYHRGQPPHAGSRSTAFIVEAEVGLDHGDPCLLIDLEVGECLRLRPRDHRARPLLEVCVERIEMRARGRRARVELSAQCVWDSSSSNAGARRRHGSARRDI